MPREGVVQFPGLQVPDLDGLVTTAADQGAPIRA